MKYEVLFNFISPVTGRILSPTNYVPYGDIDGIATPSPIIIDIRLDLINLRESGFIIGFPNSRLPSAQVLSNLANGYMINTAGIISTTPSVIPFETLTFTNFWIGNGANRPTECLVDLPACDLATTEDLSATYDNGSSGVGATLSGTGSLTIDGVSPTVGNLILVKNQTNAYENGIYELTSLGLSSFTLTRAYFYDSPWEIRQGGRATVIAGLINTLSSWLQTNIINTIGTDNIVYIGPLGGASGSLPSLQFVLNDGDSATRSALPDAQFLKDLGSGIAKINGSTGKVEIATPDVDYVTVANLDGEVASLESQIAAAQAAAEAFATAEAAAAQAAAEAFATAADVVVLATANSYASGVAAAAQSAAESYTDGQISGVRGQGGYGSIVMTGNTLSTTVTTGGTYYKILGTTAVAASSSNFSSSPGASNKLIWLGGNNAIRITYNANLSPSGIPVTITIFKNGGAASSYVAPMSTTPGVVSGSVSITAIFPVINNDYFEAYVTTATNSTAVTITDSNFTGEGIIY